MFLNSINHFRAIAIIFIVAGHCFYTIDINLDSFGLLGRTFVNLVTGGTVLFVFISGFLFHHIFYKRYKFKKFMTGKLKKVLLPYTLLSIIPISLLVLKGDSYFDFYDPQGTGFVNFYVVPTLKYYFTGGFLTAYWYIPFAMLLFLLSPLHMAFIKLTFKQQMLITLSLFVVSLLVHRPVDDIFIVQALIYFMPVYLLGIMCSEKKETIYARLKGKEIYFLLFAIAIALYQAKTGEIGNYHKPPLAYQGLDLMVIQKASLCFFFMVWLHRFENLNSKYINLLASTSFAIYFTHGFLMVLIRGFDKVTGLTTDGSPWLWYPVVTVGMLLTSLVLALGMKRLLPNHSRYIIGY